MLLKIINRGIHRFAVQIKRVGADVLLVWPFHRSETIPVNAGTTEISDIPQFAKHALVKQWFHIVSFDLAVAERQQQRVVVVRFDGHNSRIHRPLTNKDIIHFKVAAEF